MRKLLRSQAYEYPINLIENPVDRSQVFLVSSLRPDGTLFPSYLVRFAGNKAPLHKSQYNPGVSSRCVWEHSFSFLPGIDLSFSGNLTANSERFSARKNKIFTY